MGPAVVPNPGAGWPCTVIFVEIGEGGSEFCDVLQCFDELKLARSECRSEGAVGGYQSGYCGAITDSGGG